MRKCFGVGLAPKYLNHKKAYLITIIRVNYRAAFLNKGSNSRHVSNKYFKLTGTLSDSQQNPKT